MTDPVPGAWQPCPPGEVERLSAWLRLRRKLWTAASVAGVALAVAAAVGVVWGVRSVILSGKPVPASKTHRPKPDLNKPDFGWER